MKYLAYLYEMYILQAALWVDISLEIFIASFIYLGVIKCAMCCNVRQSNVSLS